MIFRQVLGVLVGGLAAGAFGVVLLIDTLRGKYANLPVDKVIAVARAGLRQDGACRQFRQRLE